MPRDDEGRALEVVVGERTAERLNRRQRLRADVGRVVVEVDFQIDLRLVLDHGRDLFTFTVGQRARGAAADLFDELGLGGSRGRIDGGLRTGRKATGQRLLFGRQSADDLVFG